MELCSTGMINGALALVNLNKQFGDRGNNSDVYPSLKTSEMTPQSWWDSLSEDQRHEVGSACVSLMIMTANCRWGRTEWKTLPKSQTKRITTVFKHRDKKWEAFPVLGMIMNSCK